MSSARPFRASSRRARRSSKEFQGGEALDAGLIAAAQAVEHYEITRYGTLLAWAKQLGLAEAEGLLEETLVEEENTDELLSELAEDAINPEAAACARHKLEQGRPRGGPLTAIVATNRNLPIKPR